MRPAVVQTCHSCHVSRKWPCVMRLYTGGDCVRVTFFLDFVSSACAILHRRLHAFLQLPARFLSSMGNSFKGHRLQLLLAATAMEMWSSMGGVGTLGSLMASFIFIRAIVREYLPRELVDYIHGFACKALKFLSSEVSISIEEYDGFNVSEVYEAVQTYLSGRSSSEARRLQLNKPKNAKEFTFSMSNGEQIVDTYGGIKLRWSFDCVESRTQGRPWYITSDEKRSYKVKFHKRDKKGVLETYLPHVMAEAKELQLRGRSRKIYTNKGGRTDSYDSRRRLWSSIAFEHPATFETLALDPYLKREIVEDLRKFSSAKDYYTKVGRAWKRGYLLYGPPGTGKSSMIAATANFLEYDIYDLELTQVKNNIELRNLLIATSSRSIIVIEDIDCSLDLTDRDKKKKKKKKEEEKVEGSKPSNDGENEENADQESRVTLSGVLNFTDGLWSCCGSERLMVFTTNHIDRLDPALLRTGRMDKRIHLSYCRFPAFKILARNYLDIEDHPLFREIEGLMAEADITPADVSEVLMTNSGNPTSALQNLIEALVKAKRDSAALETQVPEMSVEESHCPVAQPQGSVESKKISGAEERTHTFGGKLLHQTSFPRI